MGCLKRRNSQQRASRRHLDKNRKKIPKETADCKVSVNSSERKTGIEKLPADLKPDGVVGEKLPMRDDNKVEGR